MQVTVCASFEGNQKCSSFQANEGLTTRTIPLILGGKNLVCVQANNGKICHGEERNEFDFTQLSNNKSIYVAFGFTCASFAIVIITMVVNLCRKNQRTNE